MNLDRAVLAFAGTAGGVGNHRDPWLDAKGARAVGALLGDFGQLSRIRIGVDGAVAIHQNAILQAHEEHAGDQLRPRTGADDLERRAHRVLGGVH